MTTKESGIQPSDLALVNSELASPTQQRLD